jgi:dTDP-glucose 4,6-dehydratase
MTKTVVIGSNSFSGQDFVDLLLSRTGHTVIGVSRSPARHPCFLRFAGRPELGPELGRYSFHQLDMNRDMDALLALLDRERPRYIVNFAAQSEVAPSWEHPEHWFQTNTVALSRLVNHLRHRDYLERYLHVSSPEAYGSCQGRVTEEAQDNPSTPYAASKAAADMLIAVYRKQYGFPALTVRATNVYGARQQLFKIIPRSAIYIKLGRTIELHGGGVAVKSYIHVRDVSEGELAILTRGRIGERYHLSPDRGVTVREVVATMARRLGKSLDEVCADAAERPGQDAAYVIDSSKARSELDWRPGISLDEGLDDTVAWVEANWSTIGQQTLDYIHQP